MWEGDWEAYLSWLIGVELSGVLPDITRMRIGVDAFEMFISGDDSILFFKLSGPCIFYFNLLTWLFIRDALFV